MKELPPIELLRTLFEYDPETGAVRWRQRSGVRGRMGPGGAAGSLSSFGYVVIGVNYCRIGAHRIAWALMTGRWPLHEIDHINQVKNDNRWVNLREATASQNCMNRRCPANNTSGVTGVGKSKDRANRSKQWCASVYVGGVRVFFKRFHSFEEAKEARQEAERSLFGEFAFTTT